MTYFNSPLRAYYFPLIWMAFTATLQLIGNQYFRYESDVFTSLEIWRLLTAHAVHLNWMHWLLNNLGFLLLVAITQVTWRFSFWIKIIVIHGLVISIALFVFNESLKWYVGFSGVLYGLFILAALLSFKKDKLISFLILAIIMTKILAEQFWGSEISTQALLGAPVIVDAHAFGVLCGLVLGALMMTKQIKIH